MGTRGAIGFFINGKTKAAYNHYDSYPDCLGREVIKACRGIISIDALKASIDAIEVIDSEVPPTPEQIARCEAAGTVDLRVSSRSTSDWYCLLRGAQGDIAGLMSGKVPYMEDSTNFLGDSLFCEYAYIINADDGTLEFYKGFNKNASAPGRYAKNKSDSQGYVGVRLALTIPLEELMRSSEDDIDGFVKRMKSACGDED